MKPVPSAPLCAVAVPRLIPSLGSAAFQKVVSIDRAIRLSQAVDDFPNPVSDRPRGRLCDAVSRDSHPQIPRPDLLTPPQSSPSSDERAQDGRPHHSEGEDFRQPHWSNRSPSPSSPWMVSLGSFAIRLGGLWGGVQKGGRRTGTRIIGPAPPENLGTTRCVCRSVNGHRKLHRSGHRKLHTWRR